MPGIVTTPTMPVGPTSSLTAMVPVEWTSTGLQPNRGQRVPAELGRGARSERAGHQDGVRGGAEDGRTEVLGRAPRCS